MNTHTTDFGTVNILTQEAVFETMAQQILALRPGSAVALSGGSTPKKFYAWVSENPARLPAAHAQQLHWTVSDERWVPLTHADSNFGTAQRYMLRALNVPAENHIPWTAEASGTPAAAAQALETHYATAKTLYPLNFLGMGEDGHTASLFPEDNLLNAPNFENKPWFAARTVPGKGERLSLTPSGIAACAQTVVLALGAGKNERLHSIFKGPVNIQNQPIQMLAHCKQSVTWLMDEAAAKGLF